MHMFHTPWILHEADCELQLCMIRILFHCCHGSYQSNAMDIIQSDGIFPLVPSPIIITFATSGKNLKGSSVNDDETETPL
jgi:hypothetical protein